MINASIVWILVVITGANTTVQSPDINQLYVTEKKADCAALKAKWDAVLAADGVKLRCLEFPQKIWFEQRD